MNEGKQRPVLGAMSWDQIRDEYGLGWDPVHRHFYRSGPGRGSMAAVADGLIYPAAESPSFWVDIELDPAGGPPKIGEPVSRPEAPGIPANGAGSSVHFVYMEQEQRLRVWSDLDGSAIDFRGGEANRIHNKILRFIRESPLPSVSIVYLMGLLDGAEITTKTGVTICEKVV